MPHSRLIVSCAREGRKQFFFEKKNQKTFDFASRCGMWLGE
jgi:hypothetical protein